MSSELTITIKDDEKRLSKKFLLYDIYTVSDEDMIIKACIDETLKNFDGEPDTISVKITLMVR